MASLMSEKTSMDDSKLQKMQNSLIKTKILKN